jgi:hypothetical protein
LPARAGAGLDRLEDVRRLVDMELVDDRAVNVGAVEQVASFDTTSKYEPERV